MRVVCAWCRVEMREGPPARVTHGICAACMHEFEKSGFRPVTGKHA